MRPVAFLVAILLAGCSTQPEHSQSQPPVVPVVAKVAQPKPTPAPIAGFECIADIPNVTIDARYSTTNNFTGTDLYGDYSGCYLHPIAAEKLRKAASILSEEHPGWKLKVFDALRPVSVQKAMWRSVKGKPDARYVANPAQGSHHNYGFAVDLTLIDEHGNELDMGTDYDAFSPLSMPRNELSSLKKGLLAKNQIANRELLRHLMKRAGFHGIQIEWWHFNAVSWKRVRAGYKPLLDLNDRLATTHP
jgi:zinc D-Ala-D-Ala dipeptidase